MNGIIHFRKCTLTDKELLEKCDKMVDSLYDPDNKVLDIIMRHIPAKPNEDFDLVLGELIYRFNEVSEQSQRIEALTKENEQYKDAIKSRNILQEEDQTKIRELTEQVEKLKAFKEYTHSRLDDMGIPVDPESPHKLAGCRIGGRIDFIDSELSRLREEKKELVEALREVLKTTLLMPELELKIESLLSKFEVPNQ